MKILMILGFQTPWICPAQQTCYFSCSTFKEIIFPILFRILISIGISFEYFRYSCILDSHLNGGKVCLMGFRYHYIQKLEFDISYSFSLIPFIFNFFTVKNKKTDPSIGSVYKTQLVVMNQTLNLTTSFLNSH